MLNYLQGVIIVTFYEIIRKILEKQDVGVNEYSRRMGTSPRLVSDRLHHTNISINKLQEMLRVLDYKIVIVPASRRMKDDEYEITTDNTKGKRPPYMTEDGKIKLTEV